MHIGSRSRQRSAAIPARVIATCFSIICFIASAMLGLYHHNDPMQTLLNSLLVMLAAMVVGLIVGSVAQRCIDEQIAIHKQDNPIPEKDVAGREPHDPSPKTA